VKGGRSIRNLSLMNSGTLSPNPWDLTPWGPNDCSTLKALERRIGLRRDATRAPFKGLNGRGGWTTVAPTLTYATRRSLAYWKPKMVLTTGATLLTPEKKLTVAQSDGRKVSDALPRGVMIKERVLGFRWHPHAAARSLLLKVHFVQSPHRRSGAY
jgi:hypothetical protein